MMNRILHLSYPVVLILLLLWFSLVFFPIPGLISWFGRLPGDIRIETGRTRMHIPVTSMILVSLVLSGALYLIRDGREYGSRMT